MGKWASMDVGLKNEYSRKNAGRFTDFRLCWETTVSEIFNRLITQLDSLVPFLAPGHSEIYSVLQVNYSTWYTEDVQKSLPGRFDSYQTQVAHAAFLPVFSYVEAFLADITKEAFRRRPDVLPKKKEMKFHELINCESRDEMIEKMVEKETSNLFYGSFEKIGEYLESELNLSWSENSEILKAPLIRNCIIHNNSIVDKRLSSMSDLTSGNKILLSANDVHKFGIAVRELARNLDIEFERRYPSLGA